MFKNQKTPWKRKDLQYFSASLKIGTQLIWFFILVFLPWLFPQIINIQNRTLLTVNIILALITSIFYEFLKYIFNKKKKNIQWVLNMQFLSDVLLLTWFLHIFGRINGPLFILYLFTIMESAFNLSVFLPNVVVAVAVLATASEFFLLIFQNEIIFNTYTFLQLFIRLASLVFMRHIAILLAQKFILEQREKGKVEENVSNLGEVTRKLEQANNRFKNLDKQKDEFISMAAHELRAPMTAIKGYVTMVLEGDTGEISEKARDYLLDAKNINDRLIRLVNNMLNVSKIEAGKIAYQEEVDYLSSLVRSIYSQFAPEAERKGLIYTLSIPAKIKDKIKADSDRIQEVIGNIISNAIKYTERGYVKVKLTQSDKNKVRFEAEDSGPGISIEEQRNLFKKFHRVESNVGKTTGTGLGLYISKLIIERFGGEVGIKSEVGKGSIFWFELPLEN
ncbi:hypothetical protein A2159_00990 [Candidatus Woesebacteria bacterium RBG_13_34_9]|uniref:histidine kinase n=1 Tax=Candidatus Woesebacteria bacterium RBG_13_34_9 TaxID=1802477 RepID=A0A1F7X457_9BACT|nr:MAG: hypothetical protein A2159_00990 [Candidatus Woesebacteria bacterium RBG_13_34_9]